MAKSVRYCLAESLRNLKVSELEDFKANLNDFPVKEGFSNIPRGPLENATVIKLSDLLVSYYCEDYAVEVAARVLEAINCKSQAQKLIRDTGKEVQAPGMHFIERHRDALIQRTATVEEILDLLYGVVLSNEQYQNIITKGTSQEKMRELFKLVPGWDRHCKDLLYEVLKEKRGFLIRDLEMQ